MFIITPHTPRGARLPHEHKPLDQHLTIGFLAAHQLSASDFKLNKVYSSLVEHKREIVFEMYLTDVHQVMVL